MEYYWRKYCNDLGIKKQYLIVPHPERMPQIPLENITAADKMEKCLALSEAQMEYLVSTDLKSI